MMDFLRWVEETPLSRFVREDFYAYFYILIGHALGMAFLVGGGIAVCLRVLGVASGARLERFAGFFPVMWTGLALAIVSGLLLLAGYPAKALTNPIFVVKFVCLIGAGVLVWLIARDVFPKAARDEALPGNAKWLAAGALALWFGGVASGKLLLYTYKMLMAT